MNRELLEKPFDPEQIKQREGNFGKMLDYVEAHAVIQRLNNAFESEWSFHIIKHEILKDSDEVIVLGELKAGDIVKTQFGSSLITRAKDTGNIISLADDLKAAATDALKKASTLLGVGLHLYTDNSHKGPERPEKSRSDSGNGNGRITARQHKFLLDLATGKGMTKSELNQKCLNAFGSVLDYISRSDASNLIGELQSN
jgi:hypothetical protein